MKILDKFSKAKVGSITICQSCGCPLEDHSWKRCPRCHQELESCGVCKNCNRH